LGGGRKLLFCSDFVPFVFEGNKYSDESLFFVAGHEFGAGEAGEWHWLIVAGV
jgi:hypothetical protein